MGHFSDSREVLEAKRRRCMELLVREPGLTPDVLAERLGAEFRTVARWCAEVRAGARPRRRPHLRPRSLRL